MASLKNIAIFGGSGELGSVILKALVESGNFSITAITRLESNATFPSSVKVVKADYTSVENLTSALKGQDAVVSAVGMTGFQGQHVIIDAAIAAGVKRILPSEFGCDLSNPKSSALPVFGYKVATRKHLEEKVTSGAEITYTYVINGAFLDWGLEKNFIFDLKSEEPTLYNGGDYFFSTTTLDSVGQAVVGVLSHPNETKNRSVYIQDTAVSQKKLLELVRKVAPEKTLKPKTKDLGEMEKWANEQLGKGDYSVPVMVTFLFVAIFQEGYGTRLEKLDNELLGVKGKTEAEVEEIIKKFLA